jgi:hypothetical protein
VRLHRRLHERTTLAQSVANLTIRMAFFAASPPPPEDLKHTSRCGGARLEEGSGAKRYTEQYSEGIDQLSYCAASTRNTMGGQARDGALSTRGSLGKGLSAKTITHSARNELDCQPLTASSIGGAIARFGSTVTTQGIR